MGAHLVSGGDPQALDSRSALRRSVSSLAVLLGKRVDGIEVGAAAASRTLANADGELRHAVLASAGLLPREILDDDEAAEAVLRWSAVAGDPATRLDRLRELVLHPWSAIDGDGLHLRLAMLRAALERLGQGWDSLATESRPDDAAADVLVLAAAASRCCRPRLRRWRSPMASDVLAPSPSCTTTPPSWRRSGRCPSRATGVACWPTSWMTASCRSGAPS